MSRALDVVSLPTTSALPFKTPPNSGRRFYLSWSVGWVELAKPITLLNHAMGIAALHLSTLSAGIWFNEPLREMTVFAEQ
jgi:hypothetical protein